MIIFYFYFSFFEDVRSEKGFNKLLIESTNNIEKSLIRNRFRRQILILKKEKAYNYSFHTTVQQQHSSFCFSKEACVKVKLKCGYKNT